MRNKQKFNLIILDTTGSPNDTPAKYELYVSDDDLDWGEPIATGEGSSMMTIISIPTQNARYFKVVQTGNKRRKSFLLPIGITTSASSDGTRNICCSCQQSKS